MGFKVQMRRTLMPVTPSKLLVQKFAPLTLQFGEASLWLEPHLESELLLLPWVSGLPDWVQSVQSWFPGFLEIGLQRYFSGDLWHLSLRASLHWLLKVSVLRWMLWSLSLRIADRSLLCSPLLPPSCRRMWRSTTSRRSLLPMLP